MTAMTGLRIKHTFVLRTFLILAALWAAAAPAAAQVDAKAVAFYFTPQEQSFKDLYGSGPAYGGELGIRLWKSLDLWLVGNHYSATGSLPQTQEQTSMAITLIGGGLRLKLRSGSIHPYIGAGAAACMYKEDNPIGTAQSTEPGFIGQAGLELALGRFLIDAQVLFSRCTVQPGEIKADLGGFYAGLALGYAF